MSLASLLKKGSLRGFATATSATPATHDPYNPPTVATVATVAVANTTDRAANDPTQSPEALGDLTPKEGERVSTPDGGTIRPAGLSAKLLAASLALDAQIQAAEPLPGNSSEHRFDPTPTATTGRETDTHAARLASFTTKGMSHDEAAQLADKLVTRDRELDDRRLCLECTHLAGYAPTFGCRAWQRAGIATKARDSGLPRDLVQQLQRCDGFTAATHLNL
jgi:hypothetical protein